MTVNDRTITYMLEETDGSNVNISRMAGLRSALDTLRTQMTTIETRFNIAPSVTRKRVRLSIVPFSRMVNAGLRTNGAEATLHSRQPGWFNTTANYTLQLQLERHQPE